MKTRKTVIAVLITALLISAALIVGCYDQVDELSGKDTEENYQIPEGKGIIKLKISDNNARTIMPTAFPLADMYFTITCTATSGGANATYPPTGRVKYTAPVNIVLSNGTYTVVVSAYDDYDSGDTTVGVPIAGYTEAGVVINNASEDVTANLIGVTSGTDKGTFHYDVAFTAPTNGDNTSIAYTSRIMQVWTYTSPVQVGGDYNIGTTSAGNIQLNPGFYTVKIILQANKCQDRVIENILHIYPSMTSYYGESGTPMTLPAPIQNNFTVNFSLDGVTQDTTSLTLTQNVANAGYASSPGSPDSATHIFQNWVTAQGGSTVFIFATTRIFKDTTIYAKWTPKDGANITITFEIVDPGSGTISNHSEMNVGATSYDRYTYGYLSSEGQQLKFVTTLYNAVWKLNGTGLTASTTTNTDDTIVIDGNSSPDHNSSVLSTLASGTHRITVTGNVTSGDIIPVDAYIEFTINNN